jgi:hypothetical protein
VPCLAAACIEELAEPIKSRSGDKAAQKFQSSFSMKNAFTATLFTRSLQPASLDINVLLRLSIADRIEQLIEQHPNCPAPASAAVDALLQTAERLGVD